MIISTSKTTSPIIAYLIIAIFFIGCSTSDKSKNDNVDKVTQDSSEIDQTPKIQSQTKLEINIDHKSENGKVYFLGKTNLPEKTKLGLNLKNKSGYSAQDWEVYVENGKIKSVGFTERGKPLNGSYEMILFSPFNEVWQQEEVKKQLNFFTGDLIVDKDEVFGTRTLRLKETINITSEKSGKLEKIRDELIGEIYTYPFSLEVVIEKYGSPETLSGTTNEKWIAYFPKGDFTLVSDKSDNKIVSVFEGKSVNK